MTASTAGATAAATTGVPASTAGTARTTGTGGQRAVPYFCPYCADEDLRPHGDTAGAWHCRCCLRTFRMAFLGLEDPR